MHIVLLILKILGIILLVLFGLLLLVLCTVLFVPVRYQISGSWKEEKWGRVRVSWLLSAICVNGSYEKEKELQASLRVLWLKLWSMGEEEQTEPPKESKTEAAAKSRDKAETAKETKAEKSKTEQQKTEQPKAESKVQTETEHTAEPKTQTQSKAGPEKTDEKKSSTKPEAKPETKPVQKQEKAIKVAEADQEEDKIEPAEKKSHQWIRKIKAFLEKLKFSFKHFCDKLKDIKTFVREKREWLEDEKNQESLKLLFTQAKKLLAHVWPGWGKGRIRFGLDDPYYTGQILEGASLVYPFIYKSLDLEPVFDEKCLEAEGNFKGRVRVSYLLWLFWGVYRHKHTWKMIRGFLDRE